MTEQQAMEFFEDQEPITVRCNPFLLLIFSLSLPEIVGDDRTPEWVRVEAAHLIDNIHAQVPERMRQLVADQM